MSEGRREFTDMSRCEFTDMIRYSCAHCTGRWGDDDE